MEFSDVIRKRHMVRRYDPDRPVPDEVINTALGNAIRAPSAGFSQGWDFVVLTKPDERDAYWSARPTLTTRRTRGWWASKALPR